MPLGFPIASSMTADSLTDSEVEEAGELDKLPHRAPESSILCYMRTRDGALMHDVSQLDPKHVDTLPLLSTSGDSAPPGGEKVPDHVTCTTVCPRVAPTLVR